MVYTGEDPPTFTRFSGISLNRFVAGAVLHCSPPKKDMNGLFQCRLKYDDMTRTCKNCNVSVSC